MNSYSRIFFVLICLLTTGRVSHLTAQSYVPEKLREVAIMDTSGAYTHLEAGSAGRLRVLVFLSPECPLSRKYMLTLNQLQERYTGQVQFIGIVPGKSYDPGDVRQFVSEYTSHFQVYIDAGKKLSDHLQATITPEVFLLGPEGRIIYSGKIDNWAVSLGKTRQVITKRYLRDAIDRALAGEPVLVRHTRAVGCLINMF